MKSSSLSKIKFALAKCSSVNTITKISTSNCFFLLKKTLIFLSFVLLFNEIAFAQTQNNEIREIEEHEHESKDYLKQRDEWFRKMNTSDTMDSQNFSAKFFNEFNKLQNRYPNRNRNTNGANREISMKWRSIGPDNWQNQSGWNGGMGRVNCIAFDPFNASIIYVGTAAGGIWQTLNHGQTWRCITDNLFPVGILSIVVDYSNPNIIYALTGDADGDKTPKNAIIKSIGVMKSVDGGNSWTATGLTWDESSSVLGNKIMIHPTKPNILFTATSNGIYKTINSGVTWTLVNSVARIYDIEFKPGKPATMYAVSANQFFYSNNTGQTWITDTTHFHPFSARMCVGVTPARPNEVVVLSGAAALSANSSFFGCYISVGNSYKFKLKSSTPNILGYEILGNDLDQQVDYDLVLALDRLHYDTIYVGGINIWKSADTANTWVAKTHWNQEMNSATTKYIHPDQHALEINPLNNYLYAGNDGGLYYSKDGGTTWIDISNGLNISQVYTVSKFSQQSNGYFFGSQDNGFNLLDTTTRIIKHLIGADVMEANYHNGNTYAVRWAGLSIDRYFATNPATGTGPDYKDINPEPKGAWVTPFLAHPALLNDSVFVAYDKIYAAVNPTSSTSWNMIANSSNSRNYMALGSSSAKTSTLYASDTLGIYSFNMTTGSTNLIYDVSYYGSPNINDFCLSDDSISDGNVIWVAHSGFSNYTVDVTTDGGVNWLPYSSGLPEIPVYCIENIPGDTMLGAFAGTSLGVFYRDKTMAQWQLYNDGMPNVPVMDFEIDTTTNTIVAATFGRGIWISPINKCLAAPDTVIINSDGGEVICATEAFTIHAVSPCAVTYLWSTGETTADIIIAAAGTYTVTVSNAYGAAPPAEIKIYNINETVFGKEHFYGGSRQENGYNMVQSIDNNFYVAGETTSNDGDVSGYHGIGNPLVYGSDFDGWIIKLDNNYKILWQKAFGGTDYDNFNSIATTRDSGCIAIGSTKSNDGDLTGRFDLPFRFDMYVVKLKKNGEVQWQKYIGSYGGDEFGVDIDTTRDGYFIMYKSGLPNGPFQSVKLKLDFNGNIMWQKGIGYTGWKPAALKATKDFGFVTLEEDQNPSFSCQASGWYEHIIKYDSLGNMQWCYPVWLQYIGSIYNDIVQTKDSGYATLTFHGATIGTIGCDDSISCQVTKLNSQGQLQWSRCFGSHFYGTPIDLIPTNDNGVVAMVQYNPQVYDNTCEPNQPSMYFIQLDSLGAVVWEKCWSPPYNPYTGSPNYWGLTKTKYGGVAAIGQKNYFDFNTGSSSDVSLLEVNRSCPQPFSGLFTNNIASSQAMVHWNKRTCASAYVVQYRALGAATWKEKKAGNADKINLKSLLSNTTYEWRVQSDCGKGSYSPYSTTQKFKTLPLRNGEFEEDTETAFNLFPNPNAGNFTLKSDKPILGNLKVELYNNLGMLLKSFIYNSNGQQFEETFNITDVTNGFYVLKIFGPNKTENLKLIKQ